jgi:hypothetical protein
MYFSDCSILAFRRHLTCHKCLYCIVTAIFSGSTIQTLRIYVVIHRQQGDLISLLIFFRTSKVGNGWVNTFPCKEFTNSDRRTVWTRYFLCGLCVFVAARTCLPSPCLAKAFSSNSTTTTFKRHVTLQSNVSVRGVFYAVRIVSNTQYVVKGGT